MLHRRRYDTRLTAQGRVGAARTAPRVARLAPKPEVCVRVCRGRRGGGVMSARATQRRAAALQGVAPVAPLHPPTSPSIPTTLHRPLPRHPAMTRCLAPLLQLLVVSPLTRALQTAELAFGSPPGCPTIVQPLARERLYLSSDVGRPPAELAAEFPQYVLTTT